MPDLLEPADPSRPDRALTPSVVTEIAPADVCQRATDHGPRTTPVLLFDRVSKWYGPVIGINQVTLELRSGITGLVGHNGSGKSTLMRLAAGHLRPELWAVVGA